MEKQQNSFNPNLFSFKLGEYSNKNVIWIQFAYDPNLVNHIKSFTKAKWTPSKKSWRLTDTLKNRQLCGLKPNLAGKEVMAKIHPVNLTQFKKLQDQLSLRSYSKSTVRTYSLEFAQLLYLLKDFPVNNLSPEKLQSYFLYCAKELKLSENQIHSRINAVKFYFEKVLDQPKMFFDIPRPKKAKKLPKTLNKEEIKKIFKVTTNPKHLLILKLCYGMGLRVSEIVNLKIENIDSKRMQVHIQNAKGKKDRYVALPQSILSELRSYYKFYKPKNFLFEGQGGDAYSVRSAQAVFKTAMKKANIRKQIGIHGLRHSYATHLLEMGIDISLIQKLLGHNDIKTTLHYTQVSNKNLIIIPSPLDEIKKIPAIKRGLSY